MTKEHQILEAMMKLLEEQKIIIIENEMFILSPSFAAVLISSFKQHHTSAATGLAFAIKSYCPECTNLQLALSATGVMRILALSKNSIYHEIKAQLDRDIPVAMVSKEFMNEIAEKITKEKKQE